jgi:uncharacterized cupredoxin-like copper-binding protein
MKKINNQFKLYSFAIGIMLFASCNSSNTTTSNAPVAYSPPATTTPTYNPKVDPSAPVVDLNLEVDGNTMDAMHYSPDKLSVKMGSTVRIHFKNNSKDEAMQHNFVLVYDSTGQTVATAAINALDHLPTSESILFGIPSMKPGSDTTFEFAAPAAGTYQFICTYPGHYPKMSGTLTVE